MMKTVTKIKITKWSIMLMVFALAFPSNKSIAQITTAGNGDIGIGTTIPTVKLDVNGVTKINKELIVANPNSTLPTGIYTDYASGKLLSNFSVNFLNSQSGYDNTKDGAAFRIDMRSTIYPLFQWYYKPTNESATGSQMLASMSKEGNFWTKYLSVSAEYPDLNQQNQHMINGTVAHFDGRVYISEVGGVEKGFTAQTGNNFNDYLLWVEEGIVSKDFAIANTTDWPDYVFNKDYNITSLLDVEKSIKENGHLPSMPSASEVESNGFTVNDMTKRLVKTIEELTLHTIDQEKQIIIQKAQIDKQNDMVNALMQRLEKIEKRIHN